MSFISYSQNFEDVMLWRALRHVKNGTYVDVGAQDPVVDSVSRAFYEHGWRGVHIEPVPFYAGLLRQNRPDEIVLQAALGETEGTLALNIIPNTGLSTAVDVHAQRHQDVGMQAQQTLVPQLTLKTALATLAGRDVHWLKIDVEGFEEQVLKGWDSSVLRPWIMVIEATIPGSTETDYHGWEPRVLAAGYRFVYFDGLNRFYVADEHADLAAAFEAPPNVFDDVQLSGQSSWGLYRHLEAPLRAESHALHKQLEQMSTQVAGLARDKDNAERALVAARAQTHEWWSEADRLVKERQAIYASTSWRITAPLRSFKLRLQRVRTLACRVGRAIGRRVRAVLGPIARRTIISVLARPVLRTPVARLLRRHPALELRLQQFIGGAGLLPGSSSGAAPGATRGRAPSPAGVTGRAARIYAQLRKQSD